MSPVSNTDQPSQFEIEKDAASAALMNARVIVCAGTGGVGKTTIAATIAIAAARRGRKTLVLTVDPARRLATALGVENLGAEPTRVDLSSLIKTQSDRDIPPKLDACMLDPKPTFDALVTRLTPDPETQKRILDNVIYRQLSETLAGSAEYAAMEQVHEHVESGRYDLVVVDTPPSSHALDFLRAPRRLREFLEGRFVRTLVTPAMSASRFGFRIFGKSLHRMIGLLEKIAGVGFLDDLSEFLNAIDGLSGGFRERATRVEEVMLGAETQFMLVSGPGTLDQTATAEFIDELERFGVRLSAVIINRVPRSPIEATGKMSPADWLSRFDSEAAIRDEVALASAIDAQEQDAESLAAEIVACLREALYTAVAAEAPAAQMASVAAARNIPCLRILELEAGVDHLSGLAQIGSMLWPDDAEATPPGTAP